LDIATLEVLEAFLVDYPGTVLIISHDQMFLDHIITQAWLMQGDGHIECCDGHLAAWQDKICKRTTKVKKTSPPTPTKAQPKKRSYHQVQRLKALPQLIEDTEAKLNALYTKSQPPNFYQQSPETLKTHQATCAQLEQTLKAMYDEWSDLDN
jgi:ABC transport system ATP-binding/permease protein